MFFAWAWQVEGRRREAVQRLKIHREFCQGDDVVYLLEIADDIMLKIHITRLIYAKFWHDSLLGVKNCLYARPSKYDAENFLANILNFLIEAI